jgi:hypothetical protein
MKHPWFKKTGKIYTPTKLYGWLISIAMLALLIFQFIEIDKKSHSVSDTLINFSVKAFIVIIAYSLFAKYSVNKQTNN